MSVLWIREDLIKPPSLVRKLPSAPLSPSYSPSALLSPLYTPLPAPSSAPLALINQIKLADLSSPFGPVIKSLADIHQKYAKN